MLYAIAFFIGGWAISLSTTPIIIYMARFGWGLDTADEFRKKHDGNISRLGGVPIAITMMIGFFMVSLLRRELAHQWRGIVVATWMMFSVGLLDDFQPLGAKLKLAGQILVAVFASALGLTIDRITYPGGGFTTYLGNLSFPVTIFWLIAVPNIINLIDGFDGLAGGVGLFLAVTLGVVGLSSGQLPIAWMAFALAGALLGFLFFNFPPAKIFLGDGGAYLIGFSIAVLSMQSSNKGSIAGALMVTVVALGLPILDTFFAICRRAFRGFPVFQGDYEHIHHRMLNLGFSKRRIILCMYAVCVFLCLGGLSVLWSQGRTLPIAAGMVFLLALGAARYLGYVGQWTEILTQIEKSLLGRRLVRYAILQAEVLEMEVDRCRTAEEFREIFRQVLLRVGFLDRGPGVMEIELSFKDKPDWVLHILQEEKIEYWRRIAECFRPAYTKASQKWENFGLPLGHWAESRSDQKT